MDEAPGSCTVLCLSMELPIMLIYIPKSIQIQLDSESHAKVSEPC